MYGLAGFKHTPGMPDMNSKIQRLGYEQRSTRYRKGTAGQRPVGGLDSKQRYKDAKNAEKPTRQR